MILKQTYKLLLLAAGCWLTVACSSSKKTSSSNDTSENVSAKNTLSDEVKIKVDRIFIDANKAKMLGDNQQAIALFTECLRLDNKNDAAMYELANIYWGGGQKEMALLNAKKAAEINPANKWYQRLYAEVLAANGKFKEAANVYSELLKRYPEDYNYYLDKAYMLIRDNKLDDALKVYDELESKVGIDEEVVVQKQRIYVKMGKIDKAVAEMEKLIREFPKEIRYYGMLAELYDANNMSEKSMEQLQKILEIDPNNPNVYLAYADFYRKKNDRANYILNLKKAFANPNLDIDAEIRIMLPYIDLVAVDSTKRKEAFDLAEILVKVHSDEAKAHAMYGDLLSQIDSLMELAREQYNAAIKIDESKFTVWFQLGRIDAVLEKWTILLKESEQMIELFPNQLESYYFNALANGKLKKNKEAIATLEKATLIGGENKPMLSDIYSMLGDIYSEMKNNTASDSAYEKSLSFNPNNVGVLNNYSYYLSVRGEKLERAEEMSAKCNKLSPGNSAYEDTYAWVLYKLKKYDEAKIWMEKAFKSGGEDRAVLLEHYGDILYQLGMVDLAVENWKKAREKGSDSSLIGKKIADRKLYEEQQAKE